jgi:hypothetical protein
VKLAVLLLAAAGGLLASAPPALAQAPPAYLVERSWPQPYPMVADCLVGRTHATKDCRTQFPQIDQPFLKALAAHPRTLPDAPVGQRVWLLARRDRPSPPAPPAPATPDDSYLMGDAQRAVFPPDALALRITAQVALSCRIADDGWLDDCWTRQDGPEAKLGFDKATVQLARQLRFTAPLPADRRTVLTIDWSPPSLPRPSQQVLADCRVGPGGATEDCRIPEDPYHPEAAKAAMAELAAHPQVLKGAPEGQRVTLGLLRSEFGKTNTLGRGPPDRAYKPVLIPQGDIGMSRYYPERALRMGQSGRSAVRCKVTDEGKLNACFVVSETPDGWGFGLAELRLTALLRVTPPTAASPPYDERSFVLPMNWNLPGH